MFHRYPDWFAKVGYWWLSYWELDTIVSSKGFFSLPCISLPLLHCSQLGTLHLPCLMSQQSKMATAAMSHFDVCAIDSIPELCHETLWLLHWKVLGLGLFMTLPESLNGGRSGAQILTSLFWIIWCLSYETLSAGPHLMLCWFFHIGPLVPVSWHCALFL